MKLQPLPYNLLAEATGLKSVVFMWPGGRLGSYSSGRDRSCVFRVSVQRARFGVHTKRPMLGGAHGPAES